MNTTIQIFESAEFGKVRTMTDSEGEPLFCGKDVAEALGYSNSREALRKHVEKDDVTKRDTIDALGRVQFTTFINESGLYALIMGSKLESARRFRHWVTSEVLPAIRKQGGYMVAREEESDEMIMARAMQIMSAALERRDREIAQLKPRAQYADHVLDSVACLTVTQIAKELHMTGHELNRILCERGIQYPQSGQYLLYAKYARRGYAQNRTHEWRNSQGDLMTRTYLVWTETGREFIHGLLRVKNLNELRIKN
jgi:prophage antirepressor-like protein